MGKTKVVLDTNIIISAFGWDGKPKEIIEKIVENELEWVISQDQFEELSKVLDYEKFNFSEEQKEKIKAIVLSISTLVYPKIRLDIVKEDKEDNRILDCAIEGNADYIITGDSHLLKLKEFKGIKILKINDFL